MGAPMLMPVTVMDADSISVEVGTLVRLANVKASGVVSVALPPPPPPPPPPHAVRIAVSATTAGRCHRRVMSPSPGISATILATFTQPADRSKPIPSQTRPRGTLLVLSAPSGAGKSTLVRALLARDPALRFSISCTTRAPRPGEVDGQDYRFIDRATFAQMIREGAFLEHAEVFGNGYGTSRAQVAALQVAGHDVLLEIDWQGARQIRANAPECTTVFIMPPSVAELERRLRSRATDSEEVIHRRLSQALDDMSHWAEFDYVIVNEVLDEAAGNLVAVLEGHGAAFATTAPAVIARVGQLLRH